MVTAKQAILFVCQKLEVVLGSTSAQQGKRLRTDFTHMISIKKLDNQLVEKLHFPHIFKN